jgi:hypothetical protein
MRDRLPGRGIVSREVVWLTKTTTIRTLAKAKSLRNLDRGNVGLSATSP